MEEKSIKQMSLSEIEDEIKIYEKASTVKDKMRLETLQLAKKKRTGSTKSP
jgi:hypothetical protein